MTFRMPLDAGLVLLFAAVIGCDQSPMEQRTEVVEQATKNAAAEVRDETREMAKEAREQSKQTADQIRESADGENARRFADKVEQRGEAIAVSLEKNEEPSTTRQIQGSPSPLEDAAPRNNDAKDPSRI